MHAETSASHSVARMISQPGVRRTRGSALRSGARVGGARWRSWAAKTARRTGPVCREGGACAATCTARSARASTRARRCRGRRTRRGCTGRSPPSGASVRRARPPPPAAGCRRRAHAARDAGARLTGLRLVEAHCGRTFPSSAYRRLPTAIRLVRPIGPQLLFEGSVAAETWRRWTRPPRRQTGRSRVRRARTRPLARPLPPTTAALVRADAEAENMIKIILLGDSAVGKSKLVERFLVRDPPADARGTARYA